MAIASLDQYIAASKQRIPMVKTASATSAALIPTILPNDPTSFVSSGVATLLAITVVNKTHMVGLIYGSTATKWVCVAVDATGY